MLAVVSVTLALFACETIPVILTQFAARPPSLALLQVDRGSKEFLLWNICPPVRFFFTKAVHSSLVEHRLITTCFLACRNTSKRGETFGISRIGSKIKGVFKSTTMEGAMLPSYGLVEGEDDMVNWCLNKIIIIVCHT